MSELKTVKDIETYHGEYDKITDEAIKWVKQEQVNWMRTLDAQLRVLYPYSPRAGMFMQFHNITKEDLKDE